MADFEPCWAFTENEEGDYSDTPGDSGGPTKWGITLQTLRDWLHRYITAADVKALTPATAKEIARARYWDHIKGDALPAGVDLVVFDFAYNAGWSRSARFLQRCVGTIEDGQIGPKTLAGVGKFTAGALIDQLTKLHEVYYEAVADAVPSDQQFLKGWEGRAGRAAQRGLELTR